MNPVIHVPGAVLGAAVMQNFDKVLDQEMKNYSLYGFALCPAIAEVQARFWEEEKALASAMVGPMSMIVAGMLMGDQDILAVLRIRSIWKVAFLRLIAAPLIVLCILKFSGLAALAPDGESILLISLLAASAPAASNVTQIAQVYGHEGDYASAINAITTLLCIGTMPLMVFLYQL